jgi:inner membrane protein
METKGIQHFMNSYSVKMVVVSVLAILLLIPSFLIQDIIRERIALSEKVKGELYKQWGERQVVSGPVLNVPFLIREQGEGDKGIKERQGVVHFLPELISTEGVIYPEIRKRGIYKTVVYQAKIRLKGSFDQIDFTRTEVPDADYNWSAAYFTIGISDMRGIKNMPEFVVNGRKYKVEPGAADNDLFKSGITIKANLPDIKRITNFETELILNGSEVLSFEALGKISVVELFSEWPHPGFTGGFLPVDRKVTEEGFSAKWQINHLNRNFPQQWTDKQYNTSESLMGVELLIPVDHYQKSMRSVKYAILFIALNFIIFIFIEMKSKIRIHPFQYSLVAFALLIFYALLTSVGEQTGFNVAYIISALAVTLLISWYTYTILGNIRMTVWVTLLQTGLYLFLFTILQLQDYALLTGSIGLFVILAIVMRLSRQIKWYPDDNI